MIELKITIKEDKDCPHRHVDIIIQSFPGGCFCSERELKTFKTLSEVLELFFSKQDDTKIKAHRVGKG
jgi:hypothetical protein